MRISWTDRVKNEVLHRVKEEWNITHAIKQRKGDWTILIIVQRDATQSSLFIILQVHSTCFGCQPHPSSGVNKTVTTASGTGHIFRAATSLQRGHATPDDGCG